MSSPCRAALDEPNTGSLQYRQRIPVSGWIHCADSTRAILRIVARWVGGEIGSTSRLFVREDVCCALQLPADVETGFRVLGCFPAHPAQKKCVITVEAEHADGSVTVIGSVGIQIAERDYTDVPYGDLFNPTRLGLLKREHIYATGGPVARANSECLELLKKYLRPGSSVFDVGCGTGPYCEPLRALGITWVGYERDSECLRVLRRKHFPHRTTQRALLPWRRDRLPAKDGEFDAAIAIEVLEHVDDPESFVAELARVSRQSVLISVPNLEIVPLLSDRLVTPWHIIDGGHQTFFSRFNLRPLLSRHFRSVEILDYGSHPLRSPEGLLLPYHLFAICEL